MQSRGGIGSIEVAYAAVHDTVSPLIAVFFAVGLLASGLASASVGAYAGAMIMQGLLHRSIPMVLRRLATLAPALLILALGFNPTRTLVLSQVVLSFGIPFALLPLVRLTGNRALMGTDVNHRVTTAVGWLIGVLISLLNVVLIYLTVTRSGSAVASEVPLSCCGSPRAESSRSSSSSASIWLIDGNGPPRCDRRYEHWPAVVNHARPCADPACRRRPRRPSNNPFTEGSLANTMT